MSENTVLEFKKPDDPNVRREIADGIAMGLPFTAAGVSMEATAEGLGFTDMTAAFNMRD